MQRFVRYFQSLYPLQVKLRQGLAQKLNFHVASLPDTDKNMLYFYGIMAEMQRVIILTRTKATLAAAKARGIKLSGARPETEIRHKAVREEADAMSVPTERGGKWYGKTVLNAAKRL